LLVFILFKYYAFCSSFPDPIPECVASYFYTDDGLVELLSGQTKKVKITGVWYNCTGCGDCIPISSSSSGSVVTSGGINDLNDILGAAYFSKNSLSSTQDWLYSVDKKWQALKEVSLNAGFENIKDFLKAEGKMNFNDFALAQMLSYIYDSPVYYPHGQVKIAGKNSEQIESKSGSESKTKNIELPEKFSYIDDGGIYLNEHSFPMLLRNGDEDITFEERERMRLNSIVDNNRLVIMNNEKYEYAVAEAKQIKENSPQKVTDINNVFDLISDKLEGDTSGTIKDKLLDGITIDNEKLKSDAENVLTLVDISKDIKELFGLYKKGDEEGLATKTLDMEIGVLSGQLKGIQKKMADYSVHIVKTYTKKLLDETLNKIDDAVKQLNPFGPPVEQSE
ncbi:MAG TPA: hypothetical protein PLF61_00280, partial [Candidatus Goldiibacteriota bacterium]|nr:hypothetical protein [Candidatus Goldiibacteriota bacterium]